ncbi:MAG TPA: aspartate ammonia-lyase [Bacillota bacterium]|nr:aspartate ammonia-lyase [Bacillota bacterium]HPT88098.1 aspartate ammonia-lyase [Bacillota bacterium]
MSYRTEHDLLGERQIPADAYYGIHSLRARENFDLSGRCWHPELIRAMAEVKKAAALANEAAGILDASLVKAIVTACDEIIAGRWHDQFITDVLQGGAGTSVNMNTNEVIANRAIELLGGQKGDYQLVNPLDHVNLSQSTNDVFPTAVRIAALRLLKPVSEGFAQLQEALQEKEEEFAGFIKMGRTELQDALPVMLGQEFGAYAQAVARDRWRIYKAEERLRQINLGGTAVGTGLNAAPGYLYRVMDELRQITGLGLARSEYLMDATQNQDVLVEVSGMLKAAAVNLAKIANDLRWMASGPRAGLGEIQLPPVQAGSSIMPGKVNPVIPEAVRQAAFQVIANDLAVTMGAHAGEFELNPMLPLIADNLFNSLELLAKAVTLFVKRCITGITANPERCKEILEESTVYATALSPYLGYQGAALLAQQAQSSGKTIRQTALEAGLFNAAELERILDPYQLTKPGIPGRR